MDRKDKNNDARGVQCNPNNEKGGPGHQAGYDGNRDKAAMDNKGNQQNPNHDPSKGAKK